MRKQIEDILLEMNLFLDEKQMIVLERSLRDNLIEKNVVTFLDSNEEYLELFLNTKALEGCSDQTIRYYKRTIKNFIDKQDSLVVEISANQIREYLADYFNTNKCSRTTLDNIRRTLSSFFSWLKAEDYILKTPFDKIHKVKGERVVKEAISDENIEILRDGCFDCIRDLAMIDLLLSTGIRVGELVKLNIKDINFIERECIVYGKGNKERRVYFDYRAKVHLQDYLSKREDDNPALFVTLRKPKTRLTIGGVENRLSYIGKTLEMTKIHPHRFRTTLATRAIQKGMPIEQVQRILGHTQIDTTLRYALISDENVKQMHRKLLSG